VGRNPKNLVTKVVRWLFALWIVSFWWNLVHRGFQGCWLWICNLFCKKTNWRNRNGDNFFLNEQNFIKIRIWRFSRSLNTIWILTFRKTKWLIQNGGPYYLKVNKTPPNPVFGVFNDAEHEISIYLSRNIIADPKWRTFLSKS
jgi:hypothetical protein